MGDKIMTQVLYKKVNGEDIRLSSEEVTAYEDMQPTYEMILAKSKEKKIAFYKNYLIETDWYAVREIDDPNSYPEDIKNNRILARNTINLIESINTIEELNEININFS